MKKVLLLGATGAMGVHLVDILTKYDDYSVYVTSRSQHENKGNITYIKGNARDRAFMSDLLSSNKFDIIVDFMNYGYDEFAECHKELLAACDHYIFLSSCRVFADSQSPITEASPRLLDVTDDQEFLATQRYALRKARQENLLTNSGNDNFTIVRPYITYSSVRLQLGIYEKEQWLFRALNDKSIVLSDGILERFTTLSYGGDVARGIFNVFHHSAFLGESINIVNSDAVKWSDILRMYSEVIKSETQKELSVYTSENNSYIESLFEGGYNTRYDRKWDRKFDNSKLIGRFPELSFSSVYEKLPECLTEFIGNWRVNPQDAFLTLVDEFNVGMDIMTGDIDSHSSELSPEFVSDPLYSSLSNCKLKKVNIK